MRKYVVLSAVVASVLLMLGAGESTYWGRSYLTDKSSYFSGYGSGVSVDTVRMTVRDNLANTAARDSGWVGLDAAYDVVVADVAGESFRHGCYQYSTPTAVYDNSGLGGYTDKSTEDDRVNPGRMIFMWFDVSDIPNNVKIESARMVFSIQKYSTVDFTGGYLTARLDTMASDYRMINGSSPSVDPNYLATTWNTVDGTNAWAPALSTRDDFHDFGPRGDLNYIGGSRAQNTAVYIDFADALQQVVDAGTQSRGIILIPYVVGIAGSNLRVAMGRDISYAPTGNAQLDITYTTKRGQRPWGGTPMPVVIALDDADTSHAVFASTLLAAGHSYSEVFCGATMAGGASRMSQAQVDAINGNYDIDVIMHGRTHTAVGAFATDAEIDYSIYRDWTASSLSAPRDTTTGYYANYAYPVDGVNQVYTLPAMSRLVAAGYRSARAAGANGYTGDVGRENYLSWSGYTNIYMVGALNPTGIFGTASPNTNAKISDEFGDQVDIYYTNNNKAPMILYWHDTLSSSAYANSGVNYDQFEYFISVVDSASACDFMTYKQVIDLRRAGVDFIDPATVTVANGATAQNQTSAAFCDSARTANSDDNFLYMWLGPR